MDSSPKIMMKSGQERRRSEEDDKKTYPPSNRLESPEIGAKELALCGQAKQL